jgi:hypothetical protein
MATNVYTAVHVEQTAMRGVNHMKRQTINVEERVILNQSERADLERTALYYPHLGPARYSRAQEDQEKRWDDLYRRLAIRDLPPDDCV